jgi:hypothetical protein
MTLAHCAVLNSAQRRAWFWAFVIGVTLPLSAGRILAADESDNNNSGPSKTPAVTIGMFEGMKKGNLDVKFFPRNSREAQIVIKNNTDQPLTVQLPEAFAGVPVLAQAAGAGAGTRTTGNKSNQNQGVGGGGGPGGGVRPLGGNNGGGGAFNVPPEKVIKVKVAVVCLDHGKDEPNAHIPYEIRPIETYSSDPAVQELCKLLGSGTVDQRAAQAAAWHLANHMSWEELADMKRFPHLPAYTKPYFSPDEIRSAMLVSDKATKLADARKTLTPASPSGSSASTASASVN